MTDALSLRRHISPLLKPPEQLGYADAAPSWADTKLPLVATGIGFDTYTTPRTTLHASLRMREKRTSSLLGLSVCVFSPSSRSQQPSYNSLASATQMSWAKPLGADNTIIAAGGSGFPVNGTGPNNAVAYPNFFQIFGNVSDAKAAEVERSIEVWAPMVEMLISLDWMSHSSMPCLFVLLQETLTATTSDSNQIVTNFWQLLPFSRGRVERVSADPFNYPNIYVNYFDVSFNRYGCGLAARAEDFQDATAQKSSSEKPSQAPRFSTTARAHGSPLATIHPPEFRVVAHPIGVVDAQLRVCDAANVRMIDTSVFAYAA
ncbi:hypothetical protein B0H13DRAFT_2306808 [Mycena leptocephala]|nr:hypothetical protein B0H13DRAFT_2306808 [Mycena leptocephala]